ncbi:hypothetical protein Hanom_Chr16g01442101 [Helianthus anomalus]
MLAPPAAGSETPQPVSSFLPENSARPPFVVASVNTSCRINGFFYREAHRYCSLLSFTVKPAVAVRLLPLNSNHRRPPSP